MPATPIGTSFVSDERNNFNGFPNLGSVSPSSGVDRIAILAIAAEFGDPTLIVNAVDWGGRAFQRLGGTRSAAQNTLLDYWILREADYPSATSFLFATLSAPPNNNCCLVLGEGQGVDQGAILSAVTGLVADGAPSALFSQTTSAGDLIFHAAMSSEGTDLAGTPAPDAFGERLRSNDFTLEMSAWGNLPAGTADYGHARVGGEAFSNGLQVLVNIPAAGGGAPNVSVAPSPIGSGVGVGAPTANRIIQLTPQPIGSGAGVGAPTVDPKVPVEPVGIGSGAGLGAPTANRIIQLTPEPIGAGAGLGAPTANRIIRLTPEPIGAGAGVGAPDAQALVEVAPIAIAAGASAGAPQVNFAAQAVDPVAIGSGAGLGAPTVNRIIQLTPEPIGSGGNVGAPLPNRIIRIAPVSIGTGASVGRPEAMALVSVQAVGIGAGSGLAAPDGTAIWAEDVPGSAGGVFTFRETDENSFRDNGDFADLAPGATRDTTAPIAARDSAGRTAGATVTVSVSGRGIW